LVPKLRKTRKHVSCFSRKGMIHKASAPSNRPLGDTAIERPNRISRPKSRCEQLI
jgi:hypothetical protein